MKCDADPLNKYMGIIFFLQCLINNHAQDITSLSYWTKFALPFYYRKRVAIFGAASFRIQIRAYLILRHAEIKQAFVDSIVWAVWMFLLIISAFPVMFASLQNSRTGECYQFPLIFFFYFGAVHFRQAILLQHVALLQFISFN